MLFGIQFPYLAVTTGSSMKFGFTCFVNIHLQRRDFSCPCPALTDVPLIELMPVDERECVDDVVLLCSGTMSHDLACRRFINPSALMYSRSCPLVSWRHTGTVRYGDVFVKDRTQVVIVGAGILDTGTSHLSKPGFTGVMAPNQLSIRLGDKPLR